MLPADYVIKKLLHPLLKAGRLGGFWRSIYLDIWSTYLPKLWKRNEEKVRTRANGVWQVTDIFYRARNKRRLDILTDYEKKASDAKGDFVLSDLVEKYSARLLDIYLIKVSERLQRVVFHLRYT